MSPSKKSLRATEQERADVARARRRWIRKQGLLDPARLVFIDETATSTSLVRLRRATGSDLGRDRCGDAQATNSSWAAKHSRCSPTALSRSSCIVQLMPDCLPHISPHLDFSFIRETHRWNSSAADAEFTTGSISCACNAISFDARTAASTASRWTLACVLRSLAARVSEWLSAGALEFETAGSTPRRKARLSPASVTRGNASKFMLLHNGRPSPPRVR